MCSVKDMWVGRELIDDLSSGSMPDLYTAVGDECGAADLQHVQMILVGGAACCVAHL